MDKLKGGVIITLCLIMIYYFIYDDEFYQEREIKFANSEDIENYGFAFEDDIDNPEAIKQYKMDADTYGKSRNASTGWKYPFPTNLQPLKGFQYCKHLDGSIFDFTVRLKSHAVSTILQQPENKAPWVLATEYEAGDLTKLIDSIAEIYFYELANRRSDFHKKSLHTAVCFMAADGNNGFGSYVEPGRKFLRFVDKITYFDDLDYYPKNQLPKMNMKAVYIEAKDQSIGPEKKLNIEVDYSSKFKESPSKLAYLIMAHKNLERLLVLLKLLSSKDVYILVHIDEASPKLKRDLLAVVVFVIILGG